MKIAYLCADFGIPIRGHKGASVHVREMATALAAQGHDVRIFTPNPGNGNPLDVPIYTIEPQRSPGWLTMLMARGAGHTKLVGREAAELTYNVTLYRQVRAVCRSWRPDAVYERYSLFNVSGIALARRLGIPHVLEVNAPLRLERARTKGLALRPLARMVERSVFGGSDTVLVVSVALRDYTVTQGARATTTRVLPNGVDTRRFHPDSLRAQTRKRWRMGDDAFVIGFAGSLKSWHGVDILLEAFAEIRRQAPAARLLIVGEGPTGESLRMRARQLGVLHSVIFTGKVAHTEMPELLAAMDVAVAPYLEVPDFYFSPLKIYEYMASGRAVVASAVGEIPALIRTGETGFLFPPGDAKELALVLAHLAANPECRARLGATARVEALQHTWERNARTVAEMAASLAENRSPAPRRVIAEARRP